MKITKTSDTFVNESALFKHLQNMEENTWTERTVYITSDSLSGSSSMKELSERICDEWHKFLFVSS